jgi:Skp family chaperone for outer membrane proteins
MKRSAWLAVTALVPGMFLMQSTGNSSVAIVDFERAVEESAGKDTITKLNTFAAEQRDAIQKKEKEAEDLQSKLRVQDRALSASARDQLTRSLEDTQTAVEKMTSEAQQKLEQMQQQLLGPAEKKARDAIGAYAAQNSLKIVLDASILRNGIIYAHDTADITAEIIRRIAANIENPRPQKDAKGANLVGQLAHRQWITIPSLIHDVRHSDQLTDLADTKSLHGLENEPH